MEDWKLIRLPDCYGIYEISSFGNIRRAIAGRTSRSRVGTPTTGPNWDRRMLNVQQVGEIKQLLPNMTYAEIAILYGGSKSLIGNVSAGITYC